MSPKSKSILLVVTGVSGALAYCSWPLGYVVNAAIVSKVLASDLEIHGQPYSWLFILLDCVTGVATSTVAVLAWQGRRTWRGLAAPLSLLCYGLFGVFTAVDALIPLNCSTEALSTCGANLSQPNLDDVLTGLAMIALFFSMCVALTFRYQQAPRALYALALVGMLAWAVWGVVYFRAHFSSSPSVDLQRVMLTLTSVNLALLPTLYLPDRPVQGSPERRLTSDVRRRSTSG